MAHRTLIAALLALCAPLVQAQSGAVLPNTRAEIRTSTSVRDSFRISIGLPAAYARDSLHRYPVLYVLDADKSFGLARDAADWLAWAGEAEPVIVVGIGYHSGWWTKRARDMTFSRDRGRVWGDFPSAGGGEAFLAFLTNELAPHIERTYRADSTRRALAGLSFGGLFAIEALLRRPDFFASLLVIAPALAWDSSAVVRREAMLPHTTVLRTRVYTAIGEHDDPHIPAAWHAFIPQLKARETAQFSVVSEVLPGETHISAWPVGMTRGLRTLFPPTPSKP
jgi:hypothetical protein